MNKVTNSDRVLIVAAHPDDEILGCGDAIALHAAQSDQVAILILAEGLTSRSSRRDSALWKEKLEKLQHTAQKAAQVVSISDVWFRSLPDNQSEQVMVDIQP